MLVPGTGNVAATIAIVGEGPGEEEDRTGLPFVGPAGKLLDELLGLAGLARETVWLTNVIKYRATDSNGRNRKPTHSERSAGAYYLRRELVIVDPRLVVLCGGTPLQVVQPGARIVRSRGIPFQAQASARTYFPVLHPAACLRGPEEWLIWTRSDFKRIPELLAG
jgi:DNA polymerase